MPKSENQKLKLLYLQKILLEKTDYDHAITRDEIIVQLNNYGITSERKSIYNDLNCLRQFGMQIQKKQADQKTYYNIISRPFHLAELKLLVDSVQASRFITAEKSSTLIKKIESLASVYEAKQLQRQVYMTDRAKAVNEDIYDNVDLIHMAIHQNYMIKFQYFKWNRKKEMVLKKQGAFYIVSPWALLWDNENYYMIAYDNDEQKIKHYRVDKMKNIELTCNKRKGRELFEELNIAQYSNKLFGMFGGEEKMVRLECHNDMAGVMIDRFGQNITLRKIDEETFCVNVKAVVSQQFLAWIIALGDQVKVTAPEEVVEQMKEVAKRLARQYGMETKTKTKKT